MNSDERYEELSIKTEDVYDFCKKINIDGAVLY